MSSSAVICFGWDLGENGDECVPKGQLGEWTDGLPGDIADWLEEQDQDILAIEHYCHLEYSQDMLVLKSSVQLAWQGNAKELILPAISYDQIDAMEQIIQKLGIQVSGPPKWLFASYYG